MDQSKAKEGKSSENASESLPPQPTRKKKKTEDQRLEKAFELLTAYLYTANLLYMFQVSQHPSSRVLKPVSAASGTGHTTCTAIRSGLRLPIRPRWRGVAVQVV